MSALDPAEVTSWRAAIGRCESETQRLEAEPLRRYALAVGGAPDIERAPPPLPHWAFFLPVATDGETGRDGHPRTGTFLPPITLPRRMFAGATITFDAPLMIGETATATRTITDVDHKRGRSGDLVFVTVERVIAQDGTPRITERQSFVYRDDAAPVVAMPAPLAEPIDGEVWQPDEVNLFRFSAATFNGHRIHYDLPYAREVEGYPALVVHGPFTAAKLAALAGRRGALQSFSFRAQSPLFLGQPIRLQVDAGEVRAVRCDGVVAMTAAVTYREA